MRWERWVPALGLAVLTAAWLLRPGGAGAPAGVLSVGAPAPREATEGSAWSSPSASITGRGLDCRTEGGRAQISLKVTGISRGEWRRDLAEPLEVRSLDGGGSSDMGGSASNTFARARRSSS